MNEFALILAVLVVIAHVVTIFWPRKPLEVAVDKNGLPILWRNDGEQRKDVACVWTEKSTPPAAPVSAKASSFATQEAVSVASFSKAVTEFGTDRRSTA